MRLSWVEWHHALASAAQLLQLLTGGSSPIQDKDPYDGGKAVVATLPANDGDTSMKRCNVQMTQLMTM